MASSSYSGSSLELSTSSSSEDLASSNSESRVGSFFFFLLLLYGEGLELVVLGVFDSLSVIFIDGIGAVGTSIFGVAATSSLPGCCGRGVFCSTSGLSFCGVAFRDGSGARIRSGCGLATNFHISTSVPSILRLNSTKTVMIFGNDNCPPFLISLSKRWALFTTSLGFPMNSWI